MIIVLFRELRVSFIKSENIIFMQEIELCHLDHVPVQIAKFLKNGKWVFHFDYVFILLKKITIIFY